MRGPGHPAGGDASATWSINADLAPTIVDAANADPGLVMDGRSLIPVAQQPGIEQGRELLIERAAELQGDPDRALHVRRAQHRRAGALRPAKRTRSSCGVAMTHPAYAAVESQLATRLHAAARTVPVPAAGPVPR